MSCLVREVVLTRLGKINFFRWTGRLINSPAPFHIENEAMNVYSIEFGLAVANKIQYSSGSGGTVTNSEKGSQQTACQNRTERVKTAQNTQARRGRRRRSSKCPVDDTLPITLLELLHEDVIARGVLRAASKKMRYCSIPLLQAIPCQT